MSLKGLLHQKIHEMGYLSYGEMVNYCLELGFKPSNAERRLRELCADKTPQIAAITSKSKRNTEYISGWEWIAAPKEIKELESPIFAPMNTYKINGKYVNALDLPPAFKVAPKETKNQLL